MILVFMLSATTAYCHSQLPSPFDLVVYENCPQPITFTARIGQVAGAIIGAPVGFIGGALYTPFNAFQLAETVTMGTYIGALAGGTALSTITGAPAYGVYRLFQWDGCPN